MRARRGLFAIVAAVAIGAIAVDDSRADLENQVFTSPRFHARLVVPHTWRVTEQASYPGFLLWLMRSQPEGRIVVTGETFTRDLFCSWPVACRTSKEPLAARYACAIRDKLVEQKLHIGPLQAGPKENEAAHFPSVWFEYDDGSHYSRQVIAFAPDNRVISMVLATPTEAARRTHARAFDQMLRSLQSTTVEEEAAGSGSGSDAGSGSGSGSAAPRATENPIGPC